mgnify:CR=1 FL=1
MYDVTYEGPDLKAVTPRYPDVPAGLRGLQGIRITLSTADHDLHSGLVGGAAAQSVDDRFVHGKPGVR